MSSKLLHGGRFFRQPLVKLFFKRGAKKMCDQAMKQVWAGMAMMAMLRDESYEGNLADIAADAWRMADMMEREEQDRDEQTGF